MNKFETPLEITARNAQQPFLPMDILFMVTKELFTFCDVLALSAVSFSIHINKIDLLKSFIIENHPEFLKAFPENPNHSIEEKNVILKKLCMLATWQEIKSNYAKLKRKSKEVNESKYKEVNSIAQRLCTYKGLNIEGLKENWKTLFTAASIFDLKTCQTLLEEGKLAPHLGYAAIIHVIDRELLLQESGSRKAKTIWPKINHKNSERLVYSLLFDHPQGKELLKEVTHRSSKYITFAKDTNYEEKCLGRLLVAEKKENIDEPTSKQNFLMSVIFAGYLRVTKKLIEVWKIKPNIAILFYLFMQVTRHPSDSPWVTLFQTVKEQLLEEEFRRMLNPNGSWYMPHQRADWLILSAQIKNQITNTIYSELIKYFKTFDGYDARCKLFKEEGYQALIPELQKLLGLEVNYTIHSKHPQNLLEENILKGRIERVNFLLECYSTEIIFSSNFIERWKFLYLYNAQEGIQMLASWIASPILSDFQKDSIVTNLLKDGYLTPALKAYQLKSTHLSPFNQKEKIITLLKGFNIEQIEKIIETVVLEGYLDIFKQIINTLPSYKKPNKKWIAEVITRADRLDMMQWFLEKNPQETPALIQFISEMITKYDSPNLFVAFEYHALDFPLENSKDIFKRIMEHPNTKILTRLISMREPDDYQTLLYKIVKRFFQDPHNVIPSSKWLPLLQTLFKQHKGTLDWKVLDKAYASINNNLDHNRIPPLAYEEWMQLLLYLANQLSHRLQDTEKKVALQDEILNLFKLSSGKPLKLLSEWLEGKYVAFSLTLEQKETFIPKLLQSYLSLEEKICKPFSKAVVVKRSSLALESNLEMFIDLLKKFPFSDSNIQSFLVPLLLIFKRYDLLEELLNGKIIPSDTLKAHQEVIVAHYSLFGKNAQAQLARYLEGPTDKKEIATQRILQIHHP